MKQRKHFLYGDGATSTQKARTLHNLRKIDIVDALIPTITDMRNARMSWPMIARSLSGAGFKVTDNSLKVMLNRIDKEIDVPLLTFERRQPTPKHPPTNFDGAAPKPPSPLDETTESPPPPAPHPVITAPPESLLVEQDMDAEPEPLSALSTLPIAHPESSPLALDMAPVSEPPSSSTPPPVLDAPPESLPDALDMDLESDSRPTSQSDPLGLPTRTPYSPPQAPLPFDPRSIKLPGIVRGIFIERATPYPRIFSNPDRSLYIDNAPPFEWVIEACAINCFMHQGRINEMSKTLRYRNGAEKLLAPELQMKVLDRSIQSWAEMNAAIRIKR